MQMYQVGILDMGATWIAARTYATMCTRFDEEPKEEVVKTMHETCMGDLWGNSPSQENNIPHRC